MPKSLRKTDSSVKPSSKKIDHAKKTVRSNEAVRKNVAKKAKTGLPTIKSAKDVSQGKTKKLVAPVAGKIPDKTKPKLKTQTKTKEAIHKAVKGKRILPTPAAKAKIVTKSSPDRLSAAKPSLNKPSKTITSTAAKPMKAAISKSISASKSSKATQSNGSPVKSGLPAAGKSPSPKSSHHPAKKSVEIAPPKSTTKPEIVAKIRHAQAEKELRKDLAQPAAKTSLVPLTPIPPIVKGKDRLILMVRDPYWLHAHWDITRQTVDRAKVSLAEYWHTVKPILRLLKMDDSGTTSNAETVFRDIEIHGGVRNWYIEVDSPPSRFRMLMGYLSANDRFYELARSNTVITPVPGGKEATDDHWADIATDAEHVYAMSGGYGDDTQTGDLTEVFEERLKRTMDADVLSQFGSGAEGSLKRHKHFHFEVDAELIVFGSTHQEAHVSVGGEPVKVRSDGSFSIRMPLPDRRQVLPATAKSRDGVDEQTVVIAVERNTKIMEPLSLDSDDI
jgi:uncharacterized protein